MTDYLTLSYWQVGLAAGLIVANGVISIVFRLGLERTLLIASIRTVLQLLLIGALLGWVFEQQRWFIVLVCVCFMTVVAGITAVSRLRRKYAGVYLNTLLSMWGSSWLVGVYALALIFRGIEPWYQPQYVIPIMGMILGNTLNGISIGLDSILEAFTKQHRMIEMRLTLGANRWEACRPELRNAIRSGMIPIINSMMIVGLVSLPGMMTGQLLSGTAPVEAVKYQIVIMFLIASATAIGTVLSTVLACHHLLRPEHRLDRDRMA